MGKYEFDSHLQISPDKRQELNEKILYLISSRLADSSGITPTDIFNCYTGNGGLHGLKKKDYNNYHDYAEAKKEIEQGQFFTPSPVCQFLVDCIQPTQQDIIYDMTYGMGNFFNYLPAEDRIYGTELDIHAVKVAQYLYPKANLAYGDIREYSPPISADLIFGNPPFNLNWEIQGKPVLSQMYYCQKAYQTLKHAGLLAIIVPDSFLSDTFSNGSDIEQINRMFYFIVQFDLPANLFQRYGIASFPTKAMILQKKSQYIKGRPYDTQKENGMTAEEIYQKYVLPAKAQAYQNISRIYFESQNEQTPSKKEAAFREKAVKLLFDIRRNKNIRHKAASCEQFLQQYLKQKKPAHLSWKEWENTKLKKEQVLLHLKKTLSSANKVYCNEKRIVKTNYCFKEKDYSEYGLDRIIASINECVLDGDQIPGYERLLRRKRAAYENQSQKFSSMTEDAGITAFLDRWSVQSSLTGEIKHLNPVQKSEVNKLLQKRYGALQFAMGSGKSLCTLAMAQYRLKHNFVRSVLIFGTTLAIHNTWEELLTDFGIPFFHIRKRADIFQIPKGQISIITINILTSLKREMKRFIRRNSQKVMLVFDESDAISNPYSSRTKAMLSVFRKCRYKVLATGTLTRNNISESAPQLELLYNNSINQLCLNNLVYYLKDGVMQEEPNLYQGLPFPAYRKGYQLFSHSHLPKRITVFGVEQENQDIYNAEYLDTLLDKTVITKTFEEVVGRKIYKITQVVCPFSSMDRQVYRTAVEKFDTIRRDYFAEADNARKDSMFRILQQLLLLLNICADPSAAHEYTSSEPPMKIHYLLKILDFWKNEKVAIGVRKVKVADSYYHYIKQAFPERPVFLITGNRVPCKKRQAIVNMLEKTSNGILISTQQSLSESMNIDFVDKIILPELHYNNAAMSQYYFRFIRYTSNRLKRVVFLTYQNSIETNLLKMVLSKEKLNLFMKNEVVDDDELYDRFGISPEVFHTFMTLSEDQNGKLQIRWGNQKIS